MKNITLKVDDATYRKARVRAAQAGTSVSALVRNYLESLEEEAGAKETRRIKAMEELFAVAEAQADNKATPVTPLSREEIYHERLR